MQNKYELKSDRMIKTGIKQIHRAMPKINASKNIYCNPTII